MTSPIALGCPADRWADVDGVHGPALVSYNAGISACEKGEQWLEALSLLREMEHAKVDPDVISYSAGISACEQGGW